MRILIAGEVPLRARTRQYHQTQGDESAYCEAQKDGSSFSHGLGILALGRDDQGGANFHGGDIDLGIGPLESVDTNPIVGGDAPEGFAIATEVATTGGTRT